MNRFTDTHNVIFNPYTEEVVAEIALESFDDVHDKIKSAQSSSAKWRKVPLADRRAAFLKAVSRLEDNSEPFAQSMSREMLKPIAQARGEMASGVKKLRALAELSEAGLADMVMADDSKLSIRREPKGVVYTIAPWNYPFFTALNSIGPALLAGNAVVLKHSSTPTIGAMFEEYFDTLGGVSGLCRNLSISNGVSERVILESPIDHVVFTGSVAVGATISEIVGRRAQNFAKLREPFVQLSLELGGSDCAYVAADAEPTATAEMVVTDGRMHNAGQSCCAVKRILVHAKCAEEFLAAAKDRLAEEVLGLPFEDGITTGPLYGGPRAVDELDRVVKDACAKGAEVVIGGERMTKDGYVFYAPTLLHKVTTDMAVMQEEVFGPVLPVMTVESDDEAMALINHSKFGLTTAVVTQDAALQQRVIEHGQSGTVFVNMCNDVDVKVPWSGCGHSGNSMAALSVLGFHTLTRPKAVLIS